jgi:ribosomal-protein-serine acetyltransferase
MLTIHVSEEIDLKLLEVSDASNIYAIFFKNKERFRKWFGWVNNMNGVEDYEKFIIEGIKGYEEKKFFRLGIHYKNEIVGSIEIKSIDYTNKKTSIGYWLGADYEGKGIMTQSLRAILKYIFEELNLNKIELHIATENISSNKVAERLNFKKEGILRQNEWLYDHFVDHNVYSLLKNECSLL